jgi:hypothetical protein
VLPRGSMSAEKVKREKDEDEGIRGKRVKREDNDDEEPLKAQGKAKATVSSCVLVTGTEYKDNEQREKLKSLGAAWCKPLNGWVLPESARGAVEKVINGGELSAAEVASAGCASVAKDPEPSQNAGATVCVAPHKKVIHTTSRRLRRYLTLSDANALAPAGLLYPPILRSHCSLYIQRNCCATFSGIAVFSAACSAHHQTVSLIAHKVCPHAGNFGHWGHQAVEGRAPGARRQMEQAIGWLDFPRSCLLSTSSCRCLLASVPAGTSLHMRLAH